METKTIFIIRHAKSDWTTAVPDFERPLTKRGCGDARAMGGLLAAYAIDLVWCSPARRTLQTWEQACVGGAHANQVETRPSLYDTWAESLALAMTWVEDAVSVLAIVNHQPTVGGLVALLAQPSELTSQVAWHFPTAGVAILTHQGSWDSIAASSATLESFTPVRAGQTLSPP